MKTKTSINALTFFLFLLIFNSCKKDDVEPVKQNNFIGKVWKFDIPIIGYTKLSFINETECKQEQPNIFSGGFSYEFMNYTYDGNTGIITNPDDDCTQHKLKISGSDLILTHDNGYTNTYYRVE